MEPLLAKRVTITKDRRITPEKILKILADVMEQPMQKPKNSQKQKKSYSEKKNQHYEN